jgi:hypothetical protein
MGATNVLKFDDTISNEPVLEFDISNGRDIFAHYLNGTEVFALMPDGFIRTTTGYKDRYVTIGLGDIAADSDAFTYPLLRCKHDITIVDAYISVDTDIGDDDTNYQTIYLEQSVSTTDLATLTSNIAWSKRVPVTMGSVDSAAAKLGAGATLSLRFAKTASGKAMSGLNIVLRYTIDQPNNTVGTNTDNIFRIRNDIGSAAVISADITDRDFLMLRNKGVEQFRIDVNGMLHGDTPDRYLYDVINIGDITTADSKKAPILRMDVATQIEKIWIGVDTTITVNSSVNYWKLAFTDGTNTIADAYLRGPFGNAVDMTKGLLYDVGDITPGNSEIAAAGKLQVELTEVGTGPNISGLTIVVAYKKKA